MYRCARSCLKRSQVELLQRVLCRPAEHGTRRVETRAVAGTIPGAIGRVPADEAFEMRADRGTDFHVAFVVAIRCDFPPVQAYDFPSPVVHIVEGVRVGAGDTVADQVVRIIQILLHLPPETTMKGPSVHAEQVEPRILPVQVPIPRHHRTQRAERKPIAAKARRNEFAVRVLANEGQPVIRLDDLAHPPMLEVLSQILCRRC